MADSKIERQLLYYKYSQPVPETHEWYFLIINQKEKIKAIKQNLYEALKPTEEDRIIDKGKIENSGLSYELCCLVTPVCEVNFSKIYEGKTKRDRRLQPRISPNGWNDFLDKIRHGDI